MKAVFFLPLSFLGVADEPASAVEAPILIQPVKRWAIPSENPHYFGYRVGGGAVLRKRGEPPYPDDGTWGWDYRGWIIQRRVDLLWWHGGRYQGGSGRYQTDGPHLPTLRENEHE